MWKEKFFSFSVLILYFHIFVFSHTDIVIKSFSFYISSAVSLLEMFFSMWKIVCEKDFFDMRVPENNINIFTLCIVKVFSHFQGFGMTFWRGWWTSEERKLLALKFLIVSCRFFINLSTVISFLKNFFLIYRFKSHGEEKGSEILEQTIQISKQRERRVRKSRLFSDLF